MRPRRTLLSFLVAVLTLAAGCSASHHKDSAQSTLTRTAIAEKGTWVGTVDGTDALIGIVSDGVEVTVYTCDSKKMSSWFRGLVNGGHPQLADGNNGIVDLELTKDKVTGHLLTAVGTDRTFTATPAARTALYRADATVQGTHVVGGWIIGEHGEQRGAINTGPKITPAPVIAPGTTPQLVDIAIPGLPATLTAIPQAPDNTSVATANTTAFEDFVIVGMGDSYSAGEGNPFKPANLPVVSTAIFWDKLLAGAVLGQGLIGPLAPVAGAVALGAGALSAAAHLGGQNLQPMVPGITEPGREQWGGSTASPSAPADEAYRVLCHQGKSPSEKAFERLKTDVKYRSVHFVYWNFACAGSQTRHLFSAPYDGDPDHSRSPNPLPANAVPPQLNLLRAALGDDSAASASARTFLTGKNVPFFTDVRASTNSVPHVDSLYVSSGGNDIGFARIIMDCGILPLPDCGDGTFGVLNEENLVQNGGDVSSFDVANFDTNIAHDNVFPGIKVLPKNYKDFNQALRDFTVARGGTALSTTPGQVYLAEGPNPLRKTASTLCNGSEGPLHDDLVGLLSATDVVYANKMTNELNDAIDAGANAANVSPMADGRDRWNIVPLRNAFTGHAICQASRFTMTGADGLKQTGNDIGVDGLFEAADGTAHPNDAGFTAMGALFETQLRAQLDGMIATAPAKPTRLRQVSAVQNGAIGIRWDDQANNDASTQVLFRPAGSTAAFNNLKTLQGSDLNSVTLTFPANLAVTYEIKLHVCTRFFKCTDSDPIVITNQPPKTPTNVVVHENRALNGKAVSLTTGWKGEFVNLSAFVNIRAQVAHSDKTVQFPVIGNGVPPVHEFTATSAIDPATLGAAFPDGTYTVTVRGCNLLGCSTPTAAVVRSVQTVSPVQPGGPTIPSPTTTPNFGSTPISRP
jgi:hypothetical protein